MDSYRGSRHYLKMARTSNLEFLFDRDVRKDHGDPELEIVEIYQDPLIESWAWPVVSRAVHQAGEGTTRNSQFELQDLAQQRVFEAAVRATLSANVIFVAVYASRNLPDTLYRWFDTWMSARQHHPGILTALIGVSENHKSFQTHSYLQDVANRAELDFLAQNRVISNATPEFPSFSEQAREILQSQPNHYFSWGIND
jgi:hypothetical protein